MSKNVNNTSIEAAKRAIVEACGLGPLGDKYPENIAKAAIIAWLDAEARKIYPDTLKNIPPELDSAGPIYNFLEEAIYRVKKQS